MLSFEPRGECKGQYPEFCVETDCKQAKREKELMHSLNTIWQNRKKQERPSRVIEEKAF